MLNGKHVSRKETNYCIVILQMTVKYMITYEIYYQKLPKILFVNRKVYSKFLMDLNQVKVRVRETFI